MCYNCRVLLTIDMSKWHTPSLVSIRAMFYNCYKINNLDIANWITDNVTGMDFAFN
jgi:surface protein